MKGSHFGILALMVLLVGCSGIPKYDGTQTGLLAFPVISEKAWTPGGMATQPLSGEWLITSLESGETVTLKLRYSKGEKLVYSEPLAAGEYELTEFRVLPEDAAVYDEYLGEPVTVVPGEVTVVPYNSSLLRSTRSVGWITVRSTDDDWPQLAATEVAEAGWRVTGYQM